MAPNNDSSRTIRVYDPTAADAAGQDALAARFGSLDGKTVGLLNNTKDRTEIILDEVETLLRGRFPDVKVQHYRKRSVSGAGPELMDRLEKECDAIVTALGD